MQSLNGVFINDQKLEPMVPHELKEADTVQLGVRTAPDVPPEFLFKYYKALKVKRVRSNDITEGQAVQDSVKRVKLDSEVSVYI